MTLGVFIFARGRISVPNTRQCHPRSTPLARVEVRVIQEKFLKYSAHISLDDSCHGTVGACHFHFDPSFIIRGLTDLHVKHRVRVGQTSRLATFKAFS